MLKFDVPPLRKRRADIIPLAQSFIRKFEARHAVRVHRVESAMLDALVDYPWPGNVRELEHVIQRAVIYCREGVLTVAHLPPHILAGQAGPANDPSVQLGGKTVDRDPTLGRQVAITEREIIEQTLSRNNFSRTVTARELGISRVTLYNKMRKYNMMAK
jgi:DNA-binding NtrC family response regulator